MAVNIKNSNVYLFKEGGSAGYPVFVNGLVGQMQQLWGKEHLVQGEKYFLYDNVSEKAIGESVVSTIIIASVAPKDDYFEFTMSDVKEVRRTTNIKVDPKAKVAINTVGIEQKRDFWILSKARNEMHSVRLAAKHYPAFADALAKWKTKEINDEQFLPVARKYIPHSFKEIHSPPYPGQEPGQNPSFTPMIKDRKDYDQNTDKDGVLYAEDDDTTN